MSPKLKTHAKKFRKGIFGAAMGVVVGLILSAVVGLLAKNGVIPDYSVTLLGIFNFIGNLFTLKSLRSSAMLYTIGWLLGSLLLIRFMEPIDIAFNIGGPVLVMVLRTWFWFKSVSRAGAR
jgi:hypothetical protein